MERELTYREMVDKKIRLLQEIKREQITIKILALKSQRINVSVELNRINEAMIEAYERLEELETELIPLQVRLEETRWKE